MADEMESSREDPGEEEKSENKQRKSEHIQGEHSALGLYLFPEISLRAGTVKIVFLLFLRDRH